MAPNAIYTGHLTRSILAVNCADNQQTEIQMAPTSQSTSTSWLYRSPHNIVLTTSKQEIRMAPITIYTGHLTRSTSWLLIVLITSKQETRMAPITIYNLTRSTIVLTTSKQDLHGSHYHIYCHLTRSTSWLLIVLTTSKQEIHEWQQTRNTNGSITIYTIYTLCHLTRSTSWLLIVLTTSKQEIRMANYHIYRSPDLHPGC